MYHIQNLHITTITLHRVGTIFPFILLNITLASKERLCSMEFVGWLLATFKS